MSLAALKTKSALWLRDLVCVRWKPGKRSEGAGRGEVQVLPRLSIPRVSGEVVGGWGGTRPWLPVPRPEGGVTHALYLGARHSRSPCGLPIVMELPQGGKRKKRKRKEL